MDLTEAREKIIGNEKQYAGIGTLGERSLHAILKLMYEEDRDYHEVAISGYVADICRDNEIVEIQTSNFKYLRDKLKTFLPEYKVVVVHPIYKNITLCDLDESTGEIVKGRKSPVHCDVYSAFDELYAIRDFLSNDNLTIHLIMMDVEEIRIINRGKKARKSKLRYDRLPVMIDEIYKLNGLDSYRQFLFADLKSFAAADLAKQDRCLRGTTAYSYIHTMEELGLISQCGTRGRATLYQIKG